MGFSKQEYWSGLTFRSPLDCFVRTLHYDPSVLAGLPGVAHSFIELDKAMVHVISLVQFSHSVVSDSLRPHGLQHARPPCPSPTLGACSHTHPSSLWCYPTISSSSSVMQVITLTDPCSSNTFHPPHTLSCLLIPLFPEHFLTVFWLDHLCSVYKYLLPLGLLVFWKQFCWNTAAFVYVLSVAALVLQGQGWVIAVES